MTFTRAKPSGWTADVDTWTAFQANKVDLNASQGVDGTSGGSYTPSAAINITGSGLGNVDISGNMAILVGATLELVAGTAIADTDDQTLNPTGGLIREFAAPASAQRDHDLVAAGNKGRLLWLTRPGSGANAIVIHRSGFSGAAIVTLPASTWSTALLYDDGAAWRLLNHADATPGAHA